MWVGSFRFQCGCIGDSDQRREIGSTVCFEHPEDWNGEGAINLLVGCLSEHH